MCYLARQKLLHALSGTGRQVFQTLVPFLHLSGRRSCAWKKQASGSARHPDTSREAAQRIHFAKPRSVFTMCQPLLARTPARPPCASSPALRSPFESRSIVSATRHARLVGGARTHRRIHANQAFFVRTSAECSFRTDTRRMLYISWHRV